MINHHIIGLTRGRSGRMSKRGLALPAAAILVAAVAAAAPAGGGSPTWTAGPVSAPR